MYRLMTFMIAAGSLFLASCSNDSFSGTKSQSQPSSSDSVRDVGSSSQMPAAGGDPTKAQSPQSASAETTQSMQIPNQLLESCPANPPPVAPQNDPAQKEKVGTVLWEGTDEPVVRLTENSASYETSAERASGYQVFSSVLPEVTAAGWHLDVELLKGFFSNPSEGADPAENYVAWLGVTRTTEQFLWRDAAKNLFTGWYWIGTVWSGSSNQSKISDCFPQVLAKGIYRLAMRLEAGVPKIYFRKSGQNPHGPYSVPEGQLRLMMLPQDGYKFPAATIKNSGDVYTGGGGLF